MHGREVVVMKKMLAALLVLFMVCAFPVCAETNNYSDIPHNQEHRLL